MNETGSNLVCLFYRIDVTEIQVAGMVIFIVSGIFGVQIWSQQVSLLYFVRVT